MKTAIFSAGIIVTAILLTMIGCGGDPPGGKTSEFAELMKMDEKVSNALQQKRILFGHQSVGENILDGVRDLQRKGAAPSLAIKKMPEAADDLCQSGFYHFHVGRNADSKSKIDDFRSRLESGAGDRIDIALFKFCYIDAGPSTNAAALFEMYRGTMEALEKRFPQVVFVHVTLPLVTRQEGPKAWVKKILGKPIAGVADNIKRNEYNRLLTDYYEGREPIFDLAKVESTFRDGSRAIAAIQDGQTIYSLVPVFTYDDGHLNETGRQAAADELLRVLAAIAGHRTESPR
jgi:hypothetical protein